MAEAKIQGHSQKLRNQMSSLKDWWLKRKMKENQIHVKEKDN
jgi:hypothetical protein